MGYASRDNFQYGLEWFRRDFFPPVGPAQLEVLKTVRMEQDSDFSVEKICYSVDPGDLSGTADEVQEEDAIVGGFTVKIYDSTTGRYWSNSYTELSTIGGSADLPFILPTPKVMVANSEITVTLRPSFDVLSGIIEDFQNFTLILNFIGNKLFRS